ncbi:hypothetical protein CcaCcLH18_12798 [Colletotrichum camelliae]|nr:hypothetical protein CcaCcLH18_12798 [Colletotrichum camelliae]
MCPTNSNETLCGKPIDSYQDGMKVYFCRATKGRVVWALATARLSLGELTRLLRPVSMWFTAGQGEISDLNEVLTFFGALRRLCHLSHDRLDMFIPAWTKMVIRLAETMDKYARFRGSRNGMIDLRDEVLTEWEGKPEPAYAWLKFVDRERKQAKKAAKEAGEYDAHKPESLEKARNPAGLAASAQEALLESLQAQVDEAHAMYQALSATATLLRPSSSSSSLPSPHFQQRRFSSAPQDGLPHDRNGDNLAAEQSEAHPLDQFTTLALSLTTTPDLPQPRDLLLCFHDGYSPLPDTTIHVTRDSVYRTRYPHPSIPARPWGAVRLNTSIRLYHDVCPANSDDADDGEGGYSCNKGRRNLENSSNPPSHSTSSGAQWFSARIVLVALTMLAVIVVAVAVYVTSGLEPAEFRLPIHLPIVDLLQSFEPLAIRQPYPHMDILAEFIESANRVCHEPRILYRDDEWLDSRMAGLATVLNATARWKLGQLCEHVNRDLTEARRGLSDVGSSIASSTTLLLLIAMRLKTTAEGWASSERLDGSKRSAPHARPPSSSSLLSPEEETLAGFREWVGHLAPEVSSTLDTAAFEAQTSILNSITSVYTELSAFAVRLRRAGRSIDLDLLPLFPPHMVDFKAQSATSNAEAAAESQLLAPLQQGSKERDALEQSVRDTSSYVCRLGNALQAVEDMTMVLLIIIVTAHPGMATAVATNGHRFSNSSALDGWNRTIQHLPDAILSAAYSNRRGCARNGDAVGIHDESAGGRNIRLVEGGTDRTTGGTATTTRRRVVMPPQPAHLGRRGMLEEALVQKFRFRFRFRFNHPDPEEVSRTLSYAIADLKERQARLHDAQQDDLDERDAKLDGENRARENRVEEFYQALDSVGLAEDPDSGSAGAGWLAGLWSYVGLGEDSDEYATVAGAGDATARGSGESTVEGEARRFATKFGRAWRAFTAEVRSEMRSDVRDADMLGNLLMRKQMELLRQV